MKKQIQYLVGIDFGTTQSTATVFETQTGNPIIILDATAKSSYASILSFERFENDKETDFGNHIKNGIMNEYVVYEVKRYLGRQYSDLFGEAFYDDATANINKDPEDENEECVFEIPQSNELLKLKPEEIIAIELAHIKKIIKNRCVDCTFDYVVVTYPSSFSQEQLELLKRAYELADIRVIDTIKEPTAALLEYKHLQMEELRKFQHLKQNENVEEMFQSVQQVPLPLLSQQAQMQQMNQLNQMQQMQLQEKGGRKRQRRDIQEEERIMVIDIGGGTTDVCISIENGRGRSIVKGNVGDGTIGGKEFDEIMMNIIFEK